MKTYINRQKVNTRASVANAASVGGLLLLLASVMLPLFLPAVADLALILLAAGGIIAMVGIYLANRWVRKPRPEESLANALKSFDDHYRLYHYPSRLCDHVLLTPAGIIAMEVVNLGGAFSYRNGHWREAMTIGRALRYIVEPRVGDPVLVAREMVDEVRLWLRRQFDADVNVPIKALTVFTHPAAELDIEGPSFPACKIEKLRKQTTLPPGQLAPDAYEQLAASLERLTVG